MWLGCMSKIGKPLPHYRAESEWEGPCQVVPVWAGSHGGTSAFRLLLGKWQDRQENSNNIREVQKFDVKDNHNAIKIGKNSGFNDRNNGKLSPIDYCMIQKKNCIIIV